MKNLQDLDLKKRALVFARFSKLAYQGDREVLTQSYEYGLQSKKYLDKRGAEAYLFENETDIVIAVRGTQFKWRDIIADLYVIPTKSKQVGSRVHSGFKMYADYLWNEVYDVVKQASSENKNIWFTGHSLGAAVATVMALRCYVDESIKDPDSLHTFGSPRVGWPGFVENLKYFQHRWANGNDTVTTLPFWVFGYKHEVKLHYFNRNNVLRDLTWKESLLDRLHGVKELFKLNFDFVSRHSMDLYIKNIEKNMG